MSFLIINLRKALNKGNIHCPINRRNNYIVFVDSLLLIELGPRKQQQDTQRSLLKKRLSSHRRWAKTIVFCAQWSSHEEITSSTSN